MNVLRLISQLIGIETLRLTSFALVTSSEDTLSYKDATNKKYSDK